MTETVAGHRCTVCGSTRCRHLDCDEHGAECDLIICMDCGDDAKPEPRPRSL